MASPWVNDALSHAQSAFSSKTDTNILEVGGGSRTHIPLQGARYTVVDISKEQLEKNKDVVWVDVKQALTDITGEDFADAKEWNSWWEPIKTGEYRRYYEEQYAERLRA